MLKKVILYTMAVLTMLTGVAAGWYFYKKHQSKNILIPRNTSSILKVNAEALFRKKLFARKEEYTLPKISGLDVAFNIFLYRITEQTPLGFAGKLKIKNISDFTSSVAKGCEQIMLADFVFYKIKSLPLYFIHSSESLVFSTFEPDSLSVKNMQSILKGENMIPLQQSHFAEIIKEEAAISYASQKVNAQINLKKGYAEAIIDVREIAENIQHTYTPEIDTTSCVAFVYKGKAPWLLDNSFFNRTGKLQKDSLQKYFAPGFCFFINGSTDRTRQRIGYVYDDDFEKKEVVQTFVEKIPAIYLKANVHKGFCNYAYQAAFLQDTGADTTSTFIWPYNAKCSEHELAMFTASEEYRSKKIPAFFQGKEILSGRINFSLLKEKPEWNFIQKYINPFEKLYVKGFQENGHLRVEAKIICTDTNKNVLDAFFQLFTKPSP